MYWISPTRCSVLIVADQHVRKARAQRSVAAIEQMFAMAHNQAGVEIVPTRQTIQEIGALGPVDVDVAAGDGDAARAVACSDGERLRTLMRRTKRTGTATGGTPHFEQRVAIKKSIRERARIVDGLRPAAHFFGADAVVENATRVAGPIFVFAGQQRRTADAGSCRNRSLQRCGYFVNKTGECTETRTCIQTVGKHRQLRCGAAGPSVQLQSIGGAADHRVADYARHQRILLMISIKRRSSTIRCVSDVGGPPCKATVVRYAATREKRAIHVDHVCNCGAHARSGGARKTPAARSGFAERSGETRGSKPCGHVGEILQRVGAAIHHWRETRPCGVTLIRSGCELQRIDYIGGMKLYVAIV